MFRVKLNVGFDELAWFDDSPDAGSPDCVCSYCGFVISEDVDVAYRFFRPSDNTELRLHMECLQIMMK